MRPSSVALMKAPDDFTKFSMKIVSEFVLARIFVDSFVLDSKIKTPKKTSSNEDKSRDIRHTRTIRLRYF